MKLDQRARTIYLLVSTALFSSLFVAGCDEPSNDNIVYLSVQHDFQKSTCGNRLSFLRVGGDGALAGPKDANNNFTVPRGQSLIVTDIHMAFDNPTATALEKQFSLYILGISGEVVIWTAAATAALHAMGIYDRALTTGIRIAAPWQICAAFNDQERLPQIVLTGYLQ